MNKKRKYFGIGLALVAIPAILFGSMAYINTQNALTKQEISNLTSIQKITEDAELKIGLTQFQKTIQGKDMYVAPVSNVKLENSESLEAIYSIHIPVEKQPTEKEASSYQPASIEYIHIQTPFTPRTTETVHNVLPNFEYFQPREFNYPLRVALKTGESWEFEHEKEMVDSLNEDDMKEKFVESSFSYQNRVIKNNNSDIMKLFLGTEIVLWVGVGFTLLFLIKKRKEGGCNEPNNQK